VSVVQKLLIAVALMGSGLGVAFFLGKPRDVEQLAVRAPSSLTVAAPTPNATAPIATPVCSAVRLTPDASATAVSPSAPEAPALLSSLAPVMPVSMAPAESESIQSIAMNDSPQSSPLEAPIPMARLRNEAPRPIGNEPRRLAVVRRMPPVEPQQDQQPLGIKNDPYRVSMDWPKTRPSGGDANISNNAAVATPTAFITPVRLAENSQAAADPWPVEDLDESRTHIVTDGDTLEKIAGLYLDNPQRSNEIFELNRGVLSDPDLLPIGAELKIPERLAYTTRDRQGYQAAFHGDASVREAASGDLVPIRPVSSYVDDNDATPRAQLGRPVSAE